MVQSTPIRAPIGKRAPSKTLLPLRALLLQLTLLLWWGGAFAQHHPKERELDLKTFQELIAKYGQDSSYQSREKRGSLIVALAKEFIGSPYQSHTLEIEPEGVRVNLQQFDCFTLVESVVALAATIVGENHTFEEFRHQLQQLRYRNGAVTDWSSRLHYTSDWIAYNSKRGLFKNILTLKVGVPIHFNLNFISTHPNSYRALQKNPHLLPNIERSEREASKIEHLYLPKEEIEEKKGLLKDGDIVAFVTTVKGLDISHVAIAYLEPSAQNLESRRDTQKRVTFIHASTTKGEVTVEPLSLQQYTLRSKTNRGVMVIRAIF